MTGRLPYTLALIGYFGLFTLLLAWNIWLAPPQVLPVALVLLVAIGPLLFPLRGLLHERPYTFGWTSLLALAYLAHGSVEAYSNPPERGLALAEVALSLLLYVGAVWFARVRGRELKQAADHPAQREDSPNS